MNEQKTEARSPLDCDPRASSTPGNVAPPRPHAGPVKQHATPVHPAIAVEKKNRTKITKRTKRTKRKEQV
jgi:hypothetical protein